MRRTNLYLIHSADRQNGTSTNFNIQLPQAINNIKNIELLCVSIPTTIYNINSTNNIFYFFDNGTDKTVTITPGSYNSETITLALETALNLASTVNYNVTYDETTFKINIQADSNFSLRFGSYTTNTIAYTLGFINADSVASTSQIAPNALDLGNPDYYIIDIDEFPHNIKTTNNDFGTFLIPSASLLNGSTDIFYKNNSYEYDDDYQNSNISNLNIRLKTNSNKVLDLNGSDWYFIIKLN